MKFPLNVIIGKAGIYVEKQLIIDYFSIIWYILYYWTKNNYVRIQKLKLSCSEKWYIFWVLNLDFSCKFYLVLLSGWFITDIVDHGGEQGLMKTKCLCKVRSYSAEDVGCILAETLLSWACGCLQASKVLYLVRADCLY